MAISPGRSAVRRGSRGSDPRDSADERRKADATNSVRGDDGTSSIPTSRQTNRREKVMNYLKTHTSLCWYVGFVAFIESLLLITNQ